MKRTTYAGLVDDKLIGQEVVLKGWVQKRRDLGGLIFIELRDREGIVQLVFSEEFGKDALAVADKLRSEYVVEAKGKVVARDPKEINSKMKTGKIEVDITDAKILATAKTPPFTFRTISTFLKTLNSSIDTWIFVVLRCKKYFVEKSNYSINSQFL